MSELSMSLRELSELGFKPVVRLVYENDRLKPESFSWADQAGWLYAFVVGSDLKYLGKTLNVLRSRLDGYRYDKDHGLRIRTWMFQEMESGNEVWVYGLPVADSILMDAEERRLIDKYAPPWNRA